MKKITVVPLGPGNPELLTLESMKALRQSEKLVLRTGHHPVADRLTEEKVSFDTLDDFYSHFEDFDTMHAAMAEHLWKNAEGGLTFAVPDPGCDGAVEALKEKKPSRASITVLTGISAADRCLALLASHTALVEKDRPAGGLRVIPASCLEDFRLDPSVPTLITEIDNEMLAGEIKLRIGERFGDDLPCVFFPSEVQTSGRPKRILFSEADRQKAYDHTVCLYLPGLGYLDRNSFTLDDLDRIMTCLRAPDGCPWDGKQTHTTLREYLVEEAWEAVSAIDEDDMEHLADELGDVLLQIAFHANIGRDFGEFTLDDVVNCICRKMIFRHEHVFGGVHCETAEDVSRNWEKLKREENGTRTVGDTLKQVAGSLPALKYTNKIRKRAAVAPGWESTTEDALGKLRQSVDVLTGKGDEDMLSEILFQAAELCRLEGVDPELLLRNRAEAWKNDFIRKEEENR